MAGDLLPGGQTCSDCSHWEPICSRLICSKTAGDIRCDWAPSRFRPKVVRDEALARFRCRDCGASQAMRSVRNGWPQHCGMGMALVLGVSRVP